MEESPTTEIRRIRDQFAKKFGYDAMAMARAFMRKQRRSGHALVELSNSPVSAVKPTKHSAKGRAKAGSGGRQATSRVASK